MQTLASALLVLTLVLTASAVTCAAADPYDAEFMAVYQPSCNGARRIHEGSAPYCSMVDWLAGSLYNTSTFTVYSPGAALDVQAQDTAAQALAAALLASADGSPSSECESAVQRLACATAFPFCATAGSSMSSLSYSPPCRLQCAQVGRICTPKLYGESDLRLDCSSLQTNHNCLLKVPSGMFLLEPAQGPYQGIPSVYIASLVVWAWLGAYWYYRADLRHSEEALPLSKALSAVPALRIALSTIFLVFWLGCEGAGDMCQSSLATGILIYFPFVESAQMFLCLAAARGWGTTRQHLPLHTWRLHIAVVFAFYVCLTVLSGGMHAPSSSWVLYSALVYGTLYALILHAATAEMAVLDAQVRRLGPHVNCHVAWPLRQKHAMFRWFLLLVLGEVVLEAVCRYLLAARAAPFLVLVVVYEAGSAVLLAGIGACFLPRSYSPFHFMVPTSLEYGLAGQEDLDQDGMDEEAADAHSRIRSRVRRVLSARARGREQEEDVASMERLRLARAQRPSPIVETFLRNALWWRASTEEKEGGSERDQMEGLPLSTASALPQSTALADETGLEMQAFATATVAPVGANDDTPVAEGHSARPTSVRDLPDSLDLARLLSSVPVQARGGGGERALQGREWGLGGDHQLASAGPAPPAAARAALRGSARVIALTSLAPSAVDAEVVLAVQHSRNSR